jgi:hypothetical protein
MGATRREIEEPKDGTKGPGGPPRRPTPPAAGPAAKLYVAKKDFANYHFNEQEQKRLLSKFSEYGDFSAAAGDWTVRLGGKLLTGVAPRPVTGAVAIREKGSADGTSPKVLADIDGLDFPLEPLSTREKAEAFKDPPDSGGFVLAMYHYRQFLVHGAKGFTKDQFFHAGVEPFFPPLDDKPDFAKAMVMAEVIHTKHAGVPGRFYFATEDNAVHGWKRGQMIGMEVEPDRDEDGCEIVFSDYKAVAGGLQLPGKMHVRRGLKKYADFTITSATLK